MSNSYYRPSQWGVGAKLTAFTFALVGVIIGALVLIISTTTTGILEERARDSVASELRGVQNMVQMFNEAVASEAVSFGALLADSYDPAFTLDAAVSIDTAGKGAPELKSGGKVVNLDFSVPDRFTVQTGGVATVFAVKGEDFIRVTTSVKMEGGERAIGTVLDRAHPAYPLLRAGSTYVGLATLFGKQYMTRYAPVKDSAGHMVAVLFVGVDITRQIGALKTKIKEIRIGETGHFYVINAAPGKAYGNAVVHPTEEGKNLLEQRDADGTPTIRQMLEKQNGSLTYSAFDAQGKSGRQRIVTFGLFKEWNWLIAGGTYIDEITGEALTLRNQSIGIGLAALAIFAALLFLVVRHLVTRPLAEARDAAMHIAEGDLTVRMDDSQRDEIGQMATAMNAISSKLSAVVGRVRDGAEQIATASEEISNGNLDLCGRTEQQAANLAATASSMGELTTTVRQNADNSRQANQMALNASSVAAKGGAMVARVVETMESINQSSRKIADIISVIDGIAFQTNILALNAAVEAARAGEQGRGFAVVASKVRNLAQRSAGAAKEIKELINASVEQVESGSKLVGDAGATMTEVLASVSRVTDIMADISAASAEQSSGIEHVSRSIGEMDQVTQQNAALVEEASAAAEALKDQAAGLARAVGLFKLHN